MTRKPQARIGARRHARECATQLLYQLDGTTPADLDHTFAVFWANAESETRELPEGLLPETVEYTERLVRGVLEHLDEIDRTVQRSTQHWRVERMARVDRNVLRLATYELLFAPDVPGRVVLNEAIEVAKKFGTEESGAFVNGILDRIAQERGR